MIDTHTHLYPAASFGACARTEAHWAALSKSPLQTWPTPAQHIATMQACGITRSALLGWYWQSQANATQQNEFYANVCAQHPGSFLPIMALQPAEKNALQQAEYWAGQGFKGIGELHPGVQGFDINGPTFARIAGLCVEAGLTLHLHVTEPAGRPHTGRVPTPLQNIVQLKQSHPGLKLVLAHYGGGLPFYELNPYVKNIFCPGNSAHPPVVYDCAASPLLYTPQVHSTVLNLTGPQRVIFGTDYPLRLTPKKDICATTGIQNLLNEIKINVPESAWQAITQGNAQRLWGL